MKNLKVSAKLIASFALVIALAILIGIVGIYGMSRLNDAQSSLYSGNLVAVEAMGNLRELFGNERNEFRNIFINAYFLADPSFDLNGAIGKFDGYKTTADTNFVTYEKTIDPNADESAYYSAKEVWNGAYASMKTTMFSLMRAGEWEQAYELFTASAAGVIAPITNGLATSTSQNNVWASEADEAGNALFITLRWVLIAVLIVVAISSMILALYISGIISKPLIILTAFMKKASSTGDINLTKEDEASISTYAQIRDEVGQCIGATAEFIARLHKVGDVLQTVADGDLTAELTLLSEHDTMGLSLNTMMDNLNNMFGEINSATSQVATGSKQIADGSQALAQGSTEQAAAVQQLSSSISEIADKTKENAAMAGQAATLANTIKGNAEKGSRQMGEMMAAVKDINDASQSINKVIKVIDDIAFQTNILALNAAVEAARAGQHGKGFAVVAEEVRNLAAKSAAAAKDTGSLIANSMEKAELGARIADETSASLADIVSGINNSSQLIGDIARSSEDQSQGISQINRGIDQVAQVVQQNSATAEESAAASEEMNSQSDMLKSLVARFKIKENNNVYGRLPSSFSHSSERPAAIPESTHIPAGQGIGGKY